MQLPSPVPPQLTLLQKRFVDAYLLNGGKASEALTAAGSKAKNVSSVASAMWNKPHVREYLRNRALEVMSTKGIAIALRRVMALADHSESEAVGLSASEALLSRAGLVPTDVGAAVQGNININLSFRGPTANESTEKGVPLKSPTTDSSIPQTPTAEGEVIEGIFDRVDGTDIR